MNQCERIIEHLKTNGSVDRLTAFTDLGIFELSSRIVSLERKGYTFDKTSRDSVNRFGDKFQYTTYRLVDKDTFTLEG